MYWIEVTMRDSNTQRFEKKQLNEVFQIFGKYSRKSRKNCKATAIKFGRDNVQTGFWSCDTGIKTV